MDDEISEALRKLPSELPLPRTNLTEEQKDLLVKACGGPLTAKKIVNAVKTLPRQRIPFLFNLIDTQVVVDILANDVDAAIKRALAKKKK